MDSKFIFRYGMHLSDGRENGFVCAMFFRKENVAKVMLESCFSIIMYTCVNNIFFLGLLNKCDLFMFGCPEQNWKTCVLSVGRS